MMSRNHNTAANSATVDPAFPEPWSIGHTLVLVREDRGTWPSPPSPVTWVTVVESRPLVRSGLEAVVAAAPSLSLSTDGVEHGDGPAVGRVLVVGSVVGTVVGDISRRTDTGGAPVIVVSDAFTDAQMFDLLRGGAAGLLLHASVHELLEVAVRSVLDGGCFIDPSLASRLVTMAAIGVRTGGTDGLTVQEQRVLALVAREMTNRQIGEQLGLSHNTVKTHVRAAMRKLGAADRKHAAELMAAEDHEATGWV